MRDEGSRRGAICCVGVLLGPGGIKEGSSVIGVPVGCKGEGVCPSRGVCAGKKELSPGGIVIGWSLLGCAGGSSVVGCCGSVGGVSLLVGLRSSRLTGEGGTDSGSMELMSSQSGKS